MPTRAEAKALLEEFTHSDALRKHGRAVEEAMRAYARWYGVVEPQEIEKWGIVGLLHDFDYEQNPTEETHLHVGQKILRERGYPDEVVEAICSHADYMKIPRDTSREMPPTRRGSSASPSRRNGTWTCPCRLSARSRPPRSAGTSARSRPRSGPVRSSPRHTCGRAARRRSSSPKRSSRTSRQSST